MKYGIALFFVMLFFSFCFGQDDPYHVQNGFDAIYNKFAHHKFNRKISYNESDWPNNVKILVKAEYNNIPLLREMDLDVENAKVIGFSKYGELFQYISTKNDWGGITRIGDNRPNKFGEWYLIKTLDNKLAWYFAEPGGSHHPLCSIVNRVTPKPIGNNDTNSPSSFPIGTVIIILIIIVGVIFVFVAISGSSQSSQSNYSSGYSSGHSSDCYSDSSYSSDSYDSSTYDLDSYSNDSDDSSTEQESERERCPDCEIDIRGFSFSSKGDGRCIECHGSGHDTGSEAMVQFATLGVEDDKIDCPKCYGTGQCQTCGGTGYIYS
jgi:hypothetical protein